MITINTSITVYTLLTKYPELKHTMIELGFTKLTQKGVLETMGRFMTLKNGAKLQKIPLEKIQEAFNKKGYLIVEENNE